MPTSTDYRNNANECRSNAREADHPLERDMLLKMAEMYDQLAAHKTRYEPEQT